MTPESIKRELADVEASLDDAISYLVDLAGAKPTPMSPHNCRIHLDHARMYAMRLADAGFSVIHRDENHGPTLERAARLAKACVTGIDAARNIRAMGEKNDG
jgi:hypothetical protein